MDVTPSLSGLRLRRLRRDAKQDPVPLDARDVVLARDESEALDATADTHDEQDTGDVQPSLNAVPALEVKTSRVVVATLVTVLIATFVGWTVRVAHDVFALTIFKLVEVANYDVTDINLMRAATFAIDGLKSLPKVYMFKS